MTLEEYKSDLEFLLKRLKKDDSERIRFVRAYLKVKNFTDDELLLMIQMIEEQITDKALEAHENWLTNYPTDEDLLPEELLPPFKDPLQNEVDLMGQLHRLLTIPPNPFNAINPRYLTSPDQSKKFIAAETWMLQYRYFKNDGSWNDSNDLTDLVSFLNLLATGGILNYSKQKDMDSYFSNRYKMETIGELMKPNKFKKCTRFDQFRFLCEQIGIKLDELRKA